MKCKLITAFATLCLLANCTLAHENIEDMDLQEILDTFDDPNNFFINENNTTVENSTPSNNTNQEILVQNDNTSNTSQPEVQPELQPEQQTEEIPVEQPLPEYEDNSANTNAKVCVLGVGVTGAALIAFYGRKYNKKTSEEIEEVEKEVTRELLFESDYNDDISMPRKVKRTNSVNRLSKSLSLSFSSITDMFDEEKPFVTTSKYSDNYSLAKNRAYKCHFNWTPLNSDEIILRCGDLVCVKESYDDGYSLGRNLYTRYDGIFPTCCLTTPEEKFMGSELIKEGEFQSILKRVSSKKANRNRSTSVSVVIPTWM